MPKAVALVPLDGSATAEAALPWAVTFAQALGARLVLLQCVAPHDIEEGEDPEAVVRVALHYLQGVADSLQAQGVQVVIRAVSTSRDVASEITGQAEALDAVLIVLASHGRSGPERAILGSVADAVIRTAAQPVLVTHPGAATEAAPNEVRRILVPLDGSALSEAALPHAVRLADAFHANIALFRAVLHVAAPYAWSAEEQDEREASRYLREVQARLAPRTKVTQQHGEYLLHTSPAYAVVEYAERIGADLIAMTTHGRSGIRRWALGSVADTTVRTSTCPVFLIRPADPDTTS